MVCEEMAPPRPVLNKSGNTPRLTIQGTSGMHPEIQYAGILSAETSWLTLTNLVLTNQSQTVIDPSASGAPIRYYRAIMKP
jgi:hypothetical protein